MTARRWLRGGLILLAAIQAGVGGWQYFAPRSFFADVPTVAAAGPYSEHLMTDVGGLGLALAVVMGAAAWLMERSLIRVALAAYLVYSCSHLAFHLSHPAALAGATGAVALAALWLLPVFAVALLVLATRGGLPAPASEPAASRPGARR